MRLRAFAGALALASAIVVPATADVTVRPAAAPTGWPQAHSDVPADPSVAFGILPNGMRYLIRKNDTPSGQVALRLRIAAGSLYETPREAGIAHFLEHMAFRGSKNMPDGTAIKTLQSLGLAMGADLNAHTGASETVFEFDLPSGDDKTLDKGLTLTREIAGNLTLAPKSLDSERHVVLAEARQRDTPAEHMVKAALGELFGARLGAAMLPIGTVPTVQAANSSELRGFYNAWYRPSRATLLVVGDIDPKRAEAAIKAHFSDWTAARGKTALPAYTVPQPTTAQVQIFTEPGVPPAASLDWVRPRDPTPDTLAREKQETIRLIALAVLNQRFSILAHSDNAPFIEASAHWSTVDDVADVTEIDASYAPGHALDAARAMHDSVATALSQGVQANEVDEAIKNVRTFLQSRVAAADSTASAKLAADYLQAIADDEVITAPQQDLKEFDAFTHGLTPATIDAVLKDSFTGAAPELFVASPTPLQGGEAPFRQMLAQAPAKVPAAPAAKAEATATTWPYTDFGTPGTVAERRTDSALGATFVTFANGVRAIIKPTDFQKGQILVSARFGGGRLGTAKANGPDLWTLNPALLLGGVRRITPDEVQRVMAGREVNAYGAVSPDAIELNGSTRPEDFATEMQFIAAFLSDPAFRAQGFSRGKAFTLNQIAQLQTSPDGVLQISLGGILHDGDPRFTEPTAAQVQATSLDAAKALLAKPLADSPLEVIVAGDVTADDAIAALAKTVGTLPKRPAPALVTGDEALPALQKAPIVLHHKGAADQAVALIAWPTTGMFPNPQNARTLRVLSAVISMRLFDEVRTAQGLTYTPQTVAQSSLNTPGYGDLIAFADVPPGKIDDFYATVSKVVADLRDKPISDDELKRARDPLVHDLEHARQTNRYWLDLLGGADADPRRLQLIQSVIPDTERVTSADIQAAAKKYLGAETYKIEVLPGDGGK